jgi:hypothetical protein
VSHRYRLLSRITTTQLDLQKQAVLKEEMRIS